MVPWPWAGLTLFKGSKQIMDQFHGSILLEKGLGVQPGGNETGAADDHHPRTGLPGLSIAQRLHSQSMPLKEVRVIVKVLAERKPKYHRILNCHALLTGRPQLTLLENIQIRASCLLAA